MDDVSDGTSPGREELYIGDPAQVLSMGGVNLDAVSSSGSIPRFATTGKTLSYKQEKKDRRKEACRKAQEWANDKCYK